MIRKNIVWTLYLFLIVGFMLPGFVFALGVTPARANVDFVSGSVYEGSFNVLNTEGKEMRVSIYPKELPNQEYVEVTPKEIVFGEGEKEKVVNYKVRLPDEYKEPGRHRLQIVVREIPKDKQFEGTFVDATVSVVHFVDINVPYPNLYASVELKVADSAGGKAADFILYVNNLGSKNIESGYVTIDIFDANNDKVDSLKVDSISLKSGEKKAINVHWNKEVENGKYFAKVLFFYNGDSPAKYERAFNVGKRMVDILNIIAKNFRLGEIAKFNILVENNWPDLIANVYVHFLISNEETNVGDFKSTQEDIPGLSKGELIAYWDTEGVDEGEYDAKISLYYDDTVLVKDMLTMITSNSITFSGISGAVIGNSPGGKGNPLVAWIVILVLVNIGWMIYFFVKRKRTK